jgi:hypothetical protein
VNKYVARYCPRRHKAGKFHTGRMSGLAARLTQLLMRFTYSPYIYIEKDLKA